MSAERERILQMVESGAISPSEAAELLSAIGGEATGPTPQGKPPGVPQNRPWEAPFVAGVVLTGFGLLGLMRRRKANVFSRLSAWLTLLAGIAAAVIGFWSRDAPWLHINVHEPGGHNIRISLPLLLPLARAILNLARGFADADTAQQLDTASAFLDGLQRGEQPDPVTIEVDDGDGSQVQIYVA